MNSSKPVVPTPIESDIFWLRMSLVFVWVFTAFVSLWELNGQSRALLLATGVLNADLASLLTVSGALLDLILGAGLLLWPGRLSIRLAFMAMAAMTLVATVLIPSLWLHPIGPLSKNVPIAALLWFLDRRTR